MQQTALLSVDFHISPIHDLKALFAYSHSLKHLTIVDKSFSSHCHMTQTCATDVRVLTKQNGLQLTNCPNEIKYEFWRAYVDDREFINTGLFVCQHAFSLCELYMPFDKPMVLIASTRYEIGRLTVDSWLRLNKNLVAIASRKQNTIAANNMYDAEYIKHFTGLKDVPIIVNTCLYVGARYNPTRSQTLVGPSRLSKGGLEVFHEMIESLDGSQSAGNLNFAQIRSLYKHYTYEDLAAHPAIVLIPYQVSVMSIFEYYAMGVPMFAPSLELLVEWQIKHKVLDELSWNCVENRCDEKSAISAHDFSPHHGYDPNDVMNATSLRHWLKFADFYQLPGIVLFDNWVDLFQKLQNTDLQATSDIMLKHRESQLADVRWTWTDILKKAKIYETLGRARKVNPKNVGAHSRISWEAQIQTQYPNLDPSTFTSRC